MKSGYISLKCHGDHIFFYVLQPSKEPDTVAQDRVAEENQPEDESHVGEREAQGEEESTEISKIVEEQTVHKV